jgi:hypothetical protein
MTRVCKPKRKSYNRAFECPTQTLTQIIMESLVFSSPSCNWEQTTKSGKINGIIVVGGFLRLKPTSHTSHHRF